MQQYRLIPLHGKHGLGKSVKVSPEDYIELSQYHWYVDLSNGRPYVKRARHVDGRSKHIYMHRQVMSEPEGMIVDHKNGDTFDCTRANLRVTDRMGNAKNQKPAPNRGSSRYKGVSWDKARGKWEANIMADKKKRFLGRYECEHKAAHAYNLAASELHGEYAHLNQIQLP